MSVSCIYRFVGPKQKYYIGSTDDLTERIYVHRRRLNAGKHHCEHLQNAWKLYGEDYFSVEILEHVEDVNKLIEREQYWIDYHILEFGRDHVYNSSLVAGSIRGYKFGPRPQDVKDKISKGNKGRKHTLDTRLKMSKGKLNSKQNLTDEQRRIKSESMRGNQRGKGYKHTPDAKARIAEASRNRKYSEKTIEKRIRSRTGGKVYTFISPSGEVYTEITNLKEFCQSHGLNSSTVLNYVAGRVGACKGWEVSCEVKGDAENNI